MKIELTCNARNLTDIQMDQLTHLLDYSCLNCTHITNEELQTLENYYNVITSMTAMLPKELRLFHTELIRKWLEVCTELEDRGLLDDDLDMLDE